MENAISIPIKDNAIEKILLADILEHIEDDEKVISELCRIARDKALLVLSVPSGEGLLSHSPLKKLFHGERGTPQYHFRNSYNLDDLKQLLEKYNIKVLEVQYAVTLLGEIFLEILKLMLFLVDRKYTTQVSIWDMNSSLLFKLYRYLGFPFIYRISRIEDLMLSKFIKGHTIIIKCVVEKQIRMKINNDSSSRR